MSIGGGGDFGGATILILSSMNLQAKKKLEYQII
jgi:hypothetical protein